MRHALALVLLGSALSVQSAAVSAPFSGRVVGVTDGDSLLVLKNERELVVIRLDGIDCPELGQDFGRRAKQFTSDLLFDRTVDVQPRSLDRYGRTVARIQLQDRDASVEIVRAGYAWHFLRYSSDPVLAAAESAARAAHRGLWAQGQPVPPWDFRAGLAPVPEGGAAYHGNTSSLVYHRAGCPQYSCKHCTRSFTTAAEARAAGYRPAGCCNR